MGRDHSRSNIKDVGFEFHATFKLSRSLQVEEYKKHHE